MRSHALCVQETAIVSRVDGAEGQLETRIIARRNFLVAGAVGGLAWGFVLGSVVFQPAIGVVAGTLCGALVGGLSAAGFEPAWLRDAASTLRAGEAALVMATAHPQDADALALVAGESGRVIADAQARPWGPEGELGSGETA